MVDDQRRLVGICASGADDLGHLRIVRHCDASPLLCPSATSYSNPLRNIFV